MSEPYVELIAVIHPDEDLRDIYEETRSDVMQMVKEFEEEEVIEYERKRTEIKNKRRELESGKNS